ncbi:hypothetical protein SAMN04488134_105164 [Amphibacillus marinus]|uniref:Zinc-ribbon domain-containing protein n=1 Tax=Amphibacillus marinus TaxID=872970 RepID=A0A1H8N8J5_9BACI|nr:hypothetical protein [Amphibacillus marinus]SEO25910.1 hypothetical protein SAMN04488134_105164 [Amphibacillus marinus]
MYCKTCGEKNGENDGYCKKCGAPLNKEIKKEGATSTSQANKKPMTKATKIKLGVGFGLIICLIVTYQLLNRYYSFEAQVNRHIETIQEADATKLSSQLVTYDSNFEISETSIQPLISYLNETPTYMREVSDRLRNEATAFDFSYELYIEQSGKHLGMFDRYQLVIEPVYIEVETTIDGAEISVNGGDPESYQSSQVLVIGPVSPGLHAFTASFNAETAQLQYEENAVVLGGYGSDYVYLPLHAVTIEIATDIADTAVYINDNEIAQLEGETGTFGPIAWEEDSYLTLKKAYDSGALESQEVYLAEYDNYYYISMNQVEQYEVDSFLQALYYDIEALNASLNDQNRQRIANYLVEGEENSLFTTFTNAAETYVNDDDVSDTRYRSDLTDFEVIDLHTYAVTYTLEVEVFHSWDSDKDDLYHYLTFEGIVVYDDARQELQLHSVEVVTD